MGSHKEIRFRALLQSSHKIHVPWACAPGILTRVHTLQDARVACCIGRCWPASYEVSVLATIVLVSRMLALGLGFQARVCMYMLLLLFLLVLLLFVLLLLLLLLLLLVSLLLLLLLLLFCIEGPPAGTAGQTRKLDTAEESEQRPHTS